MRDPKRIREFCSRLAAAWSAVPDQRFGQLAENVARVIEGHGGVPYYVEDDEMIRHIEELCRKLAGGDP